MKALFITSLICTLLSLLAVLGFPAMTIAPDPEAESWCRRMMLVAGAFFVGWLWLTFRARPRQHTASPPRWLRRSLVFVGGVHVPGVLLFVVG